MSAFDYNRTAQTALRLLQRYGKATTLTRPGEPTYDPATSQATSTPTVSSVTAAVFPYEDRYVDGALILSTDQQALVAAAGLAEPKPGDVLLWQGKGLTVVRAKNLAPAGIFVLFDLQVRL